LIIDVLLNKTKKNIIENPNVAIIAQNLNQHNPMSYQIKGTVEIHTDGKYFQQVVDLSKNFRKESKRKKREVKSAVLVKVNEIFDNMNEGKKIIE
jgi:predicted pyridoxine 5'-phosphate oxidase superfamily flavin-nucleotide-binding protein